MTAFDGFIAEKPCAWVRTVVERVVFQERRQHQEETSFFGEESYESFIRRDVQVIHPIYKPFMNDQLWCDFFEKYLLMSREFLLHCLRNPTR